MSQGRVIIDNALLRCTRDDRDAAPLFELVRTDLGLWVWELALPPDAYADSQLEQIGRELDANRSKLASLAAGSRGYVLFLSVVADESSTLRIPRELVRLAADCGFELELFTQRSGGA